MVIQSADALHSSEGNIRGSVIDELPRNSAGSETSGTYISFLHGNREIPTLAEPRCRSARVANLKEGTATMHGVGKSDESIVPEIGSNKA